MLLVATIFSLHLSPGFVQSLSTLSPIPPRVREGESLLAGRNDTASARLLAMGGKGDTFLGICSVGIAGFAKGGLSYQD
jgi:hypothetical protein